MTVRLDHFNTIAIETLTGVVGGQASSCDDAGGPLCNRTLDVNAIEKMFRQVNPGGFGQPQSTIPTPQIGE